MSEQDHHPREEVVVLFDPVSRKTVIGGLPGNVQVGLELPDGVAPSAIHASLSSDRELQVRLAEAVRLAVTQTLGLREVRQVEQSDLEPFPLPAWARIGLPTLQGEAEGFYKFLGLSEDQIVAMQMLGGGLSLYRWYDANVYSNWDMPPTTRIQMKDSFRGHVATSVSGDVRAYITHLDQTGSLSNDRASDLLLRIDEIASTVQTIRDEQNPFGYLVNRGGTDGNGIFSQIAEAVVFSDENIRQKLDKLTIASHKGYLDPKISNKYTRVELDEVLQLVDSTKARSFIDSAKETKTLTPYNVTTRDCREFFSYYLIRELQARAPQIEIQQQALPSTTRMLNG